MSNARSLAIIRAATEPRNVDFKAAMNWQMATKCGRFEILKDVAAMANAGGGHIVIGRDEPTYTTGSLTLEEENSFDPTPVNSFVHRYLTPTHECRLESENVEGDRLVVIEVPEFETSPLIFREVGNCGIEGCRKSPHFRSADIFIRTKACQSQRVSDADEMREIISRGVQKASDALIASMQRMLLSPRSIEEPLPTSPYDEEDEHEQNEFFQPLFYPWLTTSGHIGMTVKPVVYRPGRLELNRTPTKIREYAYVVNRYGVFDGVPYEGNYVTENFANGCRLRLMKPEWRRVEGASLHRSGLYRVVRALPEDFKPSDDGRTATLNESERILWIEPFVEQVTMFYLLGRNICQDLLDDADEEIQLDLRIDGLAGRLVQTTSMDPLAELVTGLHSHLGTENVFNFPLRITRSELELNAVNIARERCATILWTFGLNGDAIVPAQRRLLGSRERTAFPAPNP